MKISAGILHYLCPVALLLTGCTAQLYDGPRRPETEVSTVTLHSSTPSISIDAASVNGTGADRFAGVLELLPGEHRLEVTFTADIDRDCEGSSRNWCYSTVITGRCHGALTTRPGRAYLVTLEAKGALVEARLSRKGYFDFSERFDEPSLGNLVCEDTGNYIR